jgi:hypothetical protein
MDLLEELMGVFLVVGHMEASPAVVTVIAQAILTIHMNQLVLLK